MVEETSVQFDECLFQLVQVNEVVKSEEVAFALTLDEVKRYGQFGLVGLVTQSQVRRHVGQFNAKSLDEGEVLDETVQHGVEGENVEENRFSPDEADQLEGPSRDRSRRRVPVVHYAGRNGLRVVPVALVAIVVAVVVVQARSRVTNGTPTVGTLERLLDESDLRTDLEYDVLAVLDAEGTPGTWGTLTE